MTQARQAAPAAPTQAPVAQNGPQGITVQPAPPPFVVTPQLLTRGDVNALHGRVNELANQLKAATSRRSQVQQQLRGAVGADKAGLEQRLGVLDQRIARIEADIDEAGRQLSSTEAQKAGSTADPGRGSRTDRADVMTPVLVCFVLFVLAPIAISMARSIWKRGSGASRQAVSPENNERMVRMEQAIDSIAIEIERVSEGQRFVTRLLAEGKTPAQVGSAQPVAERVRGSN
jgi:hypothetical protein